MTSSAFEVMIKTMMMTSSKEEFSFRFLVMVLFLDMVSSHLSFFPFFSQRIELNMELPEADRLDIGETESLFKIDSIKDKVKKFQRVFHFLICYKKKNKK